MNDATPSEINHTRLRRRLMTAPPMDVFVQQLVDQFASESQIKPVGVLRPVDWCVSLIAVAGAALLVFVGA